MAVVDQLPRGRHGLSRAEVERSQRERMLRAMAEAVAARGYANTPVAEVLRRAGVSRESFYEQFANKQECFLAAYDAGAATLLRALDAAGGDAGPAPAPTERLELVLGRYLDVLTREPAFARTFLVEVYAAGEAALARRVEVQRRFTDTLSQAVGARGRRQRFACEAVVAAAGALVTQRVCADRGADLHDLHEPLTQFVRASLAAAGVAA